jgi:hypothetical protein
MIFSAIPIDPQIINREVGSPMLEGLTKFKPLEDGNNEVAFDINVDEFFKLYFETILKQLFSEASF